jgi:hypothetical protein
VIKNSILYYTNNVVPKKLLDRTLSDCIDLVENNKDTELIITSHLPLTDKYTDVKASFNQFEDSRLTKVCVKLSKTVSNNRISPYVVGRLPNKIGSIISQIMFSLKVAKGQNIIMMEHDVLYPKHYLKDVLFELAKGYEFVLAKNSLAFSDLGFSKNPGHFLSRFSGNKDSWIEFYNYLIDKDSKQVEPGLRGIEKTESRNVLYYDNYGIYDNKNPVLDIEHGLNTYGKCKYDEYCDNDNYWGDKKGISSLFDDSYQSFVKGHMIFRYGLDSVS